MERPERAGASCLRSERHHRERAKRRRGLRSGGVMGWARAAQLAKPERASHSLAPRLRGTVGEVVAPLWDLWPRK